MHAVRSTLSRRTIFTTRDIATCHSRTRSCNAAEWLGMANQALRFEGRGDVSVAARSDRERTLACRVQSVGAVGLAQAQDAETGAEALRGVTALAERRTTMTDPRGHNGPICVITMGRNTQSAQSSHRGTAESAGLGGTLQRGAARKAGSVAPDVRGYGLSGLSGLPGAIPIQPIGQFICRHLETISAVLEQLPFLIR